MHYDYYENKNDDQGIVGLPAKTVTLTSIFSWMALALLITTAVAAGMYLLLGFGLLSPEAYMGLFIASTVGYFITFLVINFRILKQSNKSVLTPFIIYSVLMGVVLSSLALMVEISTIILAFGITTLIFGIMAGYGAITKRNLSIMGMVSMMVFIGGAVMSLFLFFFFNEELYWIVSFAMFGAIILITAYDVWMIKKQLATGDVSQNTAIYFALRLYIDFINILIRVVMFLARSASRK